MLKEQIFQIVDGANFKQGQTSKEATDTILNLFKAEVDKLTVIDDEELKQIPKGFHYLLEYKEELGWILEAQLQHAKKELLDLMGE